MKSFTHGNHNYTVDDKLHATLVKNMTWRLQTYKRELRSPASVYLGDSYLHGIVCQCKPDCDQKAVLVKTRDLEGFIAKLG
jgi:hypothetical protein